MIRNALLAFLVSLNLLLLAGIVLATTREPLALAQDAAQQAAQAVPAPGLAQNYLVVAGEIQDQYDALYLLDTSTRNLYAFRYDRGRRELELFAARDLESDFRNNREGK
jgi:hypothetical protein